MYLMQKNKPFNKISLQMSPLIFNMLKKRTELSKQTGVKTQTNR